MNRDDILKMAREAGAERNNDFPDWSFEDETLERFAALVAAAERKRIESRPWGAGKEWIARAVEAEREACAQIAFNAKTYIEAAAAIRSRGER
jgi:hypothetical protein